MDTHLSDLGTEADNISNPLSIVPGPWEELGAPWEKQLLSPTFTTTWSEAAECVSSLSSQVAVAHRQKDKRPRVLLSGSNAADTVCVSLRACVLAALSSVGWFWWWWRREEDSNSLKQWTESLGTSQWQNKKKSLEQVTYHVSFTLCLILGGSWSRTSPCTLPCQYLWWRWT